MLTDEMRAKILHINLNRTTTAPKQSRRFRYNGEQVVEVTGKDSSGGRTYPYKSSALAVADPSEIPEAMTMMRAGGVALEYDEEGYAIIESEEQFRKAAKVAGLWSGRDGYGYDGEHGRETSGRVRADEERTRKRKVTELCRKLREMPETVTKSQFVNAIEDIVF